MMIHDVTCHAFMILVNTVADAIVDEEAEAIYDVNNYETAD